MELIRKILSPENIYISTNITSKRRLFEFIGLKIEEKRGVPRAATFTSLLNRERLGSTGIGHGVALPHGKVRGLETTTALFVKSQSLIPFESSDNQPVDCIFCLLSNETEKPRDHVVYLGEIASFFSNTANREAVRSAEDTRFLYNFLIGEDKNV